MNSQYDNAVSPDCRALEEKLDSLLARVERRQALMPAHGADGEVNRMMLRGLRETRSLTHAFIRATFNGYPPQAQAQKFIALADHAPHFVGLYRTLEEQKNLSPLFDRILKRENQELFDMMGNMHAILTEDSARLLALLPEKAAAPKPGFDPLAAGFFCMFLPFAVASGIVRGLVSGRQESDFPPDPQPNYLTGQTPKTAHKKPRLTLVYDSTP